MSAAALPHTAGVRKRRRPTASSRLLDRAAWAAGRGRGRCGSQLARGIALAGVALSLVLLPVAIGAQPSFDLRRDLMSDLAARGAAMPLLGQAIIASLALSHAALGTSLFLHRLRLAAGAAWVGSVCLVGTAVVQITCPRGASGCSGPDSGRAFPRPAADVVHRDLVAVFELASVVVAVVLARHAFGLGRTRLAVLLSACMVLSPAFLLGQQVGTDIGWWQLSWLAVTCTVVLAAVATLRPAAGSPRVRAAHAGRGAGLRGG